MAFAPEDWIDVKTELPEEKTWVRLSCVENGHEFVCNGWLETTDQEGNPHFYSPSDGWVEVISWRDLPFSDELYETY
jgi:hypothetical protein